MRLRFRGRRAQTTRKVGGQSRDGCAAAPRRSKIGDGWFLGGIRDELVGRAILHAIVGVMRLVGLVLKAVFDHLGHLGP
jgi:hypothetical protein